MAIERTYVMLKPDALQRGIAGQIIARIERRGYRIDAMKTMQLDEAILREHYAHIADKPYFPATVEYMTSGPVVAMVVEGCNIIMQRMVEVIMTVAPYGVFCLIANLVGTTGVQNLKEIYQLRDIVCTVRISKTRMFVTIHRFALFYNGISEMKMCDVRS